MRARGGGMGAASSTAVGAVSGPATGAASGPAMGAVPGTGGGHRPAAGGHRPAAGGEPGPTRVVDPRGRSKVLRPLPAQDREAAVARGLAAYARGDFYLAHEELEPAWMAATDPGDRERLGGLIKLAAAFVHATRGNPAGARKNLGGARERLTGAATSGRDGGLDLPALLAAIDDRLARLEAEPGAVEAAAPRRLPVPDPPHDVAGPPGRAHRPPLDLEPPALVHRSPG